MDYHILRKAVDNANCVVVVHLPTPSGASAAGRSWNDVLIDVDGVTTVVPRHKTSFKEENNELVKGRICEVVITFEFSNTDLTNAQRRQEIRNHVAHMKLDILNMASVLFKEKFGPYDWYLYAEDVPEE